jgi:pyridoxine 4-dehydrogenase
VSDTVALGPRRVRRIGYGAMRLPGPGVWGPPADRGAALAVLRRAVALGVDHIDTAQYYGPAVANELIRAALHPYPEHLALVTKVGYRRGPDRSWQPADTPAELRAAVEENLRALGAERLALVNLRLGGVGAGSGAPLAEQLGALAELRDAGLVEAIGVSNVTVEQLDAARAVTDIAGVQNLFNLVDRRHAPLLEATARHGLAFVPFFPLGAAGTAGDVLGEDAVARVAERRGATPAQVALAWLLAQGDHVALIPGTASLAHLEENLAAAELQLEPADLAELDPPA